LHPRNADAVDVQLDRTEPVLVLRAIAELLQDTLLQVAHVPRAVDHAHALHSALLPHHQAQLVDDYFVARTDQDLHQIAELGRCAAQELVRAAEQLQPDELHRP